MQRDMAERECSNEMSVTKEGSAKGRVLTYDEIKAAEAAFRGEPFNPVWSAAAAQVYAGIVAVQATRQSVPLSEAETDSDQDYIRC